jgi:hypothetical protein
MTEFADWPEGYRTLTAETIDGVAYLPDGQAVVLFTSDHMQKICLILPMIDLERITMQIEQQQQQQASVQ